MDGSYVPLGVQNLHLGNLVAPEERHDARGHFGRDALLPALDARDVPLIRTDRGADLGLRDTARDPEPAEWRFDHGAQSMGVTYFCQEGSNASRTLQRSMRPANVGAVDYSEWLRLVGRNIKRRRERRDMSQAELGGACGSDQGGISRLESGAQGFMGDTFFRLAVALGCEPWQLLHPEFHPQFLPEAMTPAAALELHELRQREKLREAMSNAHVEKTARSGTTRERGSLLPPRPSHRQQPVLASADRPASRKPRP